MSVHHRTPASLPLQTRLAPLEVIGAQSRVVEVIWTTGATVRRHDHDGWENPVPFDEVLLVTPEAVDLARLKSGAPVLDSHRAGTVQAQRAVVDDAWLSGGKGFAKVRFPRAGTDPESDRLFAMVQEKIVRNISVGYAIDRVRVVAAKAPGEVQQRIIERWTPYELSFVTVPADAGAQTRSADRRSFPLHVETGGARACTNGEVEAARARMRMRALAAGLKA